jgi:peptide/nickel transport system substrate-binding protein
MNHKRFLLRCACLCALGVLLSAAIGLPYASAERASAADARMGAWVDSVVMTSQPGLGEAVNELKADNLDIYARGAFDLDVFGSVQSEEELETDLSFGLYYEITFNPSGPLFNNGKLNPFHNAAIREAVNWLVDRDKIAYEMFEGLALPRFFPIEPSLVDYTRYFEKCGELEAAYAYDPDTARQVISDEMLAMGAVLTNGVWYYNGEPVTLIFIIRKDGDGMRIPLGNYVADQLESAHFEVERQYKTSSEASPIWVQSDPAEGQWHLYTGAWSTNIIDRDEGGNFEFFYLPSSGYGFSPLWQAYSPSAEFNDTALKLSYKDFSGMSERQTLFERALELSLNDPGAGSLRAWLVEGKVFDVRRANVSIANDLAEGITAMLWPYTVRFNSQEGGQVRFAQADLLIEPWNPVGGSSWAYDSTAYRATQDYGLIRDPHDGLYLPQRVDYAEVVVRQGIPVQKTLDWVILSFVPEIAIPDDAWVDWDAANQVFITAAQKFTETQTANVKSVVHYPADLFTTVKWHDGSPLDISDFILQMILRYDRGKPESAVYDESAVGILDYFMSQVKGIRITNTNPLVIETYLEPHYLDAEWNVFDWWPNYAFGPAAWHNLAIGIRAEAAQELVFTVDKANATGLEWMNYTGGASLGILAKYLNQSVSGNYIPYQPTLGAYITPAEASGRWSNLQTWYAARNHFWLGTGPFSLGVVNWEDDRLTLLRNADFPDEAGKWDAFVADPALALNYAGGAPGSYLTVTGTGFPGGTTEFIIVNGVGLAAVPVDAADSMVTGNSPGIQAVTAPGGSFSLILKAPGGVEGFLEIKSRANRAKSLWFDLDSDLPLRPQEGSGEVVQIPAAIVYTDRIFIPMVDRGQ